MIPRAHVDPAPALERSAENKWESLFYRYFSKRILKDTLTAKNGDVINS